MGMVKIFCDRCKGEVQKKSDLRRIGEVLLAFQRQRVFSSSYLPSDKDTLTATVLEAVFSVEVCGNCFKKFKEWTNG